MGDVPAGHPGRRPVVVFLGDSITAGAPWPWYFPEAVTHNAGVPGDTTLDVLRRLPGVLAAVSRPPDVVAVLAGTNDLGFAGRSVAETAGTLEEIGTRLRDGLPGTAVLLQSVLPRTAAFGPRIGALNAAVRAFAERDGIDYLDVWPALADARGRLRRGLTTDGVHLTPAGYDAWLDVLAPAVRQRWDRSGAGQTSGPS